MATYNDNNANFVNLKSIPQIQSITNGNFIIVSTPNGVRLIDWANVNVPNLTETGGASFTDTITAVQINAQSMLVQTLCAYNVQINGIPGFSSSGYYNQLTTQNGIITSASYIVGSPEYTSLFSIIGSVSSYLTRTQPNVYCAYATVSIPNGKRYANVLGFGTDPTPSATPLTVPVNITSFNYSDFHLMYLSNQTFSISAQLVVNGYVITGMQQLSAQIDLGQYNTSGVSLSAEIKVLKYY